MSKPFRFSTLAWMILPLIALGFLVRVDQVRMQRVVHTTGLFAERPELDAGSPTGYAGEVRELIVPENNNDSYHWIVQTQQMLARGEWRLRHVDYDNAPSGRTVDWPAPYRWWLGWTAWLDQAVSGRSLGLAVEQAALFADPLLHLLLIVGAMAFVAWRFGIFPAALVGTGLATLYPLTGWFVPGAPDDNSLSLACSVWSMLPLLAGVRALHHSGPSGGSAPTNANPRAIRWFYLAGITGGFGAWVGVDHQVPIIVGIFLGGLIAAWATRRDAPDTPPGASWAEAWQAWAFAGATTVLVACLIEYFPSHLGAWQLRAIHPSYGLAWLGLGAILVQASAWIRQGKPSRQIRPLVMLVLGILAVGALPVLMWKLKNEGFLGARVSSFRLEKLSDSPVGSSLLTWLKHDGLTPKAWATLLPVLLVIPAGWLIASRSTRGRTRAAVAIALGPVLVALSLTGRHLSGWSLLDGALLTLLVTTTAAVDETTQPRTTRWLWTGAVTFIMGLGAIQLWPPSEPADQIVFNKPTVIGLIDRDMGRWLAKHTSPGMGLVLAPPAETTALSYYGGLRGLGTLAWENFDGINAAVRIVSASTPEEAKELIDSRGVTHLVIPSWDSYLDEYARIGMGQLEGTFLSRLHAWRVPSWLRPVAYQLPNITGFEGQSVKIFEVVENQGDAAALSRIAEYFIDTGQLDQAAAVGQALRQFPADLGALVARAEVEFARGETAAFTESVERLRPRLTGTSERRLPWDRRVNLAVVLMQAKQPELARKQVQHCLTEVDDKKLRALPTSSLYRLQVLAKAFGLGFSDPRLHQLALDLLPSDLRQRL